MGEKEEKKKEKERVRRCEERGREGKKRWRRGGDENAGEEILLTMKISVAREGEREKERERA